MIKFVWIFIIGVVLGDIVYQIVLNKNNRELKIICENKRKLIKKQNEILKRDKKIFNEKTKKLKNLFINENWIVNKLKNCPNISKIEQTTFVKNGRVYEKGNFVVEINDSYKGFMKCIYLLEKSRKLIDVDEFNLSESGGVFTVKYFGVSF